MTSENPSWAAPLTVGSCGVRGDGTWWWSAAVFRLLGFAPGDVLPTEAALLAHVRPSDRASVRALLAHSGDDEARLVHVVGFDGDEQLVVLHGERGGGETRLWFVAIDGPFDAAVRRTANQQLADALGSRSVIDRAKGVLAAVRGCDDDEAFELLRAASQRGNVRLRAVAERVIDAASPSRPGLVERIDTVLGATETAGPAEGEGPREDVRSNRR